MSQNFFGDEFSSNTKDQTEASTNKARKELKEKEQAANDKKKVKVLKEALNEERAAKEDAFAELSALKQRLKELENENHETSTKYLKLYEENDRLQEQLQQSNLLQPDLTKKGSQQGTSPRQGGQQVVVKGGSKEYEEHLRSLEEQCENDLSVMRETVKKAEKECNQAYLEMNHYKNMAVETAEKLDKAERKINELTNSVNQLEDRKITMQCRVEEYEVRIGQLNIEKTELRDVIEGAQARIKDCQLNIEKRDAWITHLKCDIDRKDDEIIQRDQMLKEMSQTIMKRGQQNQRLSEVVNTFKNQLIVDQLFSGKYFYCTWTTQVKTFEYWFQFVRDKGTQGEFFLDIHSYLIKDQKEKAISQTDQQQANPTPNANTKAKRISILDVEEIEPTGQGHKFNLHYFCYQSYFTNQKTLKVEGPYESKFLADILDNFEQVRKEIDNSQMRREDFMKGDRPLQGVDQVQKDVANDKIFI